MEARRNEEAVEEPVEAGAERSEGRDPLTERHEPGVDDRPDEHQDDGDHEQEAGGDDRDGALAGEERERVGQLRVFELVVAPGADETGDDADEDVLHLAEGGVDVVDAVEALQVLDGRGRQQRRDRQPPAAELIQ